jgi:replicative DNA helicase
MLIPIQKTIDKILNDTETKMGLSTGIVELDNAILGLRPAHLIMIAACSGMGKSALMTDIALAAAEKTPVAMFSMEMGVHLTAERMIFNVANLNFHRGMSGDLSIGDKEDLKAATEIIKKLNDIYIDEESDYMYPDWFLKKETPENSIEVAIERYYKAGCRIFFIDYLQIVGYGFKSESETLRIKKLTNKLHKLTIKYQVPIVALCQLKKDAAEKRQKGKDTTPILADIRDSGYIINDSDIILLLHRPEYFERREEINLFANQVENARIIVAKQRSGPRGPINVKFKSYSMSWCSDIIGGI